MADPDARLTLLLSLADDELVIGHRHSQWTGWAPYLEEDLAFSSIAQDELAHARLLYRLAREAGLTDRDEDALALGREPHEYRNAVLCERPNGDWGYTIARQYLYDTADALRLQALSSSSWRELAEAARLMLLEERYHVDHARAWFDRLANGPSLTARGRLAQGLSAAVGDALGLFEPLPGEEELVAQGVLPRPNEDLLAQWLEELGRTLEAASLDYVLERHAEAGEMVPTGSGEIPEAGEALSPPGVVYRDGRWVHEGGFTGPGGRRGRHSEEFVALWEEMTGLYRAHPGARW
ncbi:MAG TPA: 1,2-phenylacetyl-CoA epoxidase subunit PaaC [Actinomycetota bacterium]|nr:1,2-phenylacetyl-CoA epoxidase subunit PaaC [Actinomycetota bacterium]